MPQKLTEFSASSNGDRWLLEQTDNTGESVVVHRANPASGGTETRLPVTSFLAITGDRPEAEALKQLLARITEEQDGQTADNEARPVNRSPWANPPGSSTKT